MAASVSLSMPFENRQYYVYIMTNETNSVLYIGVTNNLARRVVEHKQKGIVSFTAKYNVTKLVYYDCAGDIRTAIEAEKRLKGWSRVKKIDLITTMNPEFKNLSEDLIA